MLSLVSERLSFLLLAVPPSIEKEDVEDTVKVPEGEMAHLMCNVSGKGHTADWRRVKRWELIELKDLQQKEMEEKL